MSSYTKSRSSAKKAGNSGEKFLFLLIILLTVSFSQTVTAQKISLRSEGFEISFPKKIQKLVLDPLPAGTYSIGAGGYFATIQSAFDKLSTDGIAGEVTLELIDNLYTAPTDDFGFFLNGPIPGAGPNSRVTIKPAENKNVIIEGNGYSEFYLLNTSYITIDGISLTGATTLTIHSIQNSQFAFNFGIFFADNSDHNVIQNTIGICEDIYRGAVPILFYVETPGISAAPDSNLIKNNFIKKAGVAILVSAEFSLVKAIGNIIRENIVGSETDSLISWGIQAQFTQNTVIENNIVQNIRRYYWKPNPGINSYFGIGDIIRNNVVHNIYVNTGAYGGIGILLSGDVGKTGSNNLVYNNMVYNIRSSSTQSGASVGGIKMWYQNNPKVYYNSVYLNGDGNGANPNGSAALYVSNNSTNVEAKNNIFVNTRDESPYCASSIYDYMISNLSSDYNDLSCETNQYNCLVRIGSTKYNTLAEWQATGKDLNSISEMPNFVSPDLHIDWNIFTLLDGHATSITGITTDFDNEPRNAITPDIGADEFTITPTFFQLLVNVTNGWNMVSVPGLHPTNQNVNTWWQFRDLGADVFKYLGGYQSVTTAAPGIGYWMKHSGTRTYNTGDEWPAGGIQIVPHTPLAGASGWNLIGGYEQSVATSVLTTNPPGLITGPVYKYSTGYQIATTLDPGYGYWIKLTGAGQIIIPNALEKGSREVEYFADDWGKITITDATGVSYTLYAVKGEVDLDLYELPPAPMAGMFDIRFSSGRIAEDINSAIKTIEMSGVTYPLTVRVENMDIRLMDETGKTVNVNLKSGEDVVISDATINKLMVSGELIPAEYALEQNYPNPFNPSTVIEFSLPENVGNVKLSIYNALGEKVAELVNTALTAGKYQYQWNAQNVATGMYIYELRTDKFVSVKKMILLK